MDLTLRVSAPDLSEEESQILFDNFSSDLNDAEIEFSQPKYPSVPGAKSGGDPITIGTIVLTLIGSGGLAVALVNVVNTYVNRGTRLEVEVKNENGRSVKIGIDNFGTKQLAKTVELINHLVEDKNG